VAALNALVPKLDAVHWTDPDWQALITRLLVHETYFFRDWPQLEHLALNGLPERIANAQAAGHRALCIWSAGCASGEEAYTLAAITLQAMLLGGVAYEHGDTMQPQAGWRLDVIGSDLSAEMIERAGRGRYATAGLSPFRAMRDGYGRLFPADGPGARSVRGDLRARVRFVQDNLLDGPPPVETARQVALSKLTAAVAEGGYLLLGPTDPRPPSDRFEAIWSSGPVIYRRKPSMPPPSP
jgi:chemotaxis protein methyltransferase CheR